MIILHAGFLNNRLLVWGEVPADSARPASKRRGRKPKVALPEALPYDAGNESLLGAFSESWTAATHKAEPAIVWLPTDGGVPAASSPLIADPPTRSAEVVLSAWTVTACPLSAADSLHLLSACADRQTLAPGVHVGRDFSFWVSAMRFAAALVGRQQFLPDVIEIGGIWEARWQPVFAGADAERLGKLAASMPAVCRALSSEPGAPPSLPAASVLARFVGEIVDYIVRSSLFPQIPVARRTPEFHSIHDQWLHALRTPGATRVADTKQAASFAAQLREWRRPISVIASSPFRLCFRLEEPADVDDHSADSWRAQYLLQAVDDPSLMIPAKDAWSARGRKASILKERGFNARDYLLAALGQASRVCPHIEDSLRTAKPDGYMMNSTDAHQFLTHTSLLLEQSGFGVILPGWWTRKGTKLRLSARANVKSPSMGTDGLSLGNMLRGRLGACPRR